MREPVSLFMALGTQWRWTGSGFGAIPIGLDYTAIAPAAAALEVKLTPALFNDIRVLELEALRVWSKRRNA